MPQEDPPWWRVFCARRLRVKRPSIAAAICDCGIHSRAIVSDLLVEALPVDPEAADFVRQSSNAAVIHDDVAERAGWLVVLTGLVVLWAGHPPPHRGSRISN